MADVVSSAFLASSSERREVRGKNVLARGAYSFIPDEGNQSLFCEDAKPLGSGCVSVIHGRISNTATGDSFSCVFLIKPRSLSPLKEL